MSTNTLTPEFRVSFPYVFKAQLNKLSGKEEYSLQALFPPNADLSKLKAAAQEAIKEKWGPDSSKWPKNLKNPFRDQAEKEKEIDDGKGGTKKVMPDGYVKGAIFLTLKSKQKPGVVDQKVEDIIDPSVFYAGCWARATVSCYAYDQAGNRGVSFGLGNIQKTRDGDPFGGRTKASEDFVPIQDDTSAPPAASGKSATSLFD